MRTRAISLKLLVVILFIPLVAGRCEYLSQPYFNRLATRIEAGEPPGVAYMDVLRTPEYIREGRLMPLDNLIGEDDWADFHSPLLEYFQRDGQMYVCPRDFQTVALLVNMDLLEEAGLQPPTTWDELYDAAAKLTETTGGFGVGLTSNLWNWLPFLFQAGGSLLDESGTEMTLLTEEAHKALTFYVDLHLAGYAFLPEGELWLPIQGREQLLQAFAQGDVAMILGANDFYALLQKQAPDMNLQVVELPAGPAGKATIAYVVGYGLLSESGTGAGPALDLLRLTCAPEGMKIWSQSPIYMPTRQSLQDEWMAMHPEAVAFMAGVDYLHSYQPATASFKAIEEFDRQATSHIAAAMRGEISVEDALESLQAEGTAMLQQY